MRTYTHMSYGVQGMINLLNEIITPMRDPEWYQAMESFKQLKKQGIKTWSDCPEAVETEPNVWRCPSHLYTGEQDKLPSL